MSFNLTLFLVPPLQHICAGVYFLHSFGYICSPLRHSPACATDPSFHPRTSSPSSWTTCSFALRGRGVTRCSAAGAAQSATPFFVYKVLYGSSSTSPTRPVGRDSRRRTRHGQACLRLAVSLHELRALRSLLSTGLADTPNGVVHGVRSHRTCS